MAAEDIEVKVEEINQRSKSNTKRLDKLEHFTVALTELTTSVKVMVTKQEYIADKVDGLDCKVNTLEQRPAKKWEATVDKVLNLIIGAIIAYLLVKLGIAQ